LATFAAISILRWVDTLGVNIAFKSIVEHEAGDPLLTILVKPIMVGAAIAPIEAFACGSSVEL
jgi:hypothetical protein